MTSRFSVIAVATMTALGGMVASSSVQARDEGAIIGGVLGGLAVGAIVGGAAQQHYYEPAPVYRERPMYAVPRREMCVEQREVWSNRHQNYIVRNVRVSC